MRTASVAAALGILALSGCGGGQSGPRDHIPLTAFERRGKALFVPTCGLCHQLADAGTGGSAGPALTSPLTAPVVRETIANGSGAMPSKLVTGPQAAEVAAYVAAATKPRS